MFKLISFNSHLQIITILLMLFSGLAYSDATTDGENGIIEFRKGNLIEAMKLLQHSAEQGYAPAQTTLAYILDQSEEDERAFHWYQQAALQGNAEGQFGLGNMYAKGEGVELNKVKAGEWIKKSALQMHVPAMRAYAHALEYGNLGLKQDSHAAGQWYIKAANSGDNVSMRRLAQAYLRGELGFAINQQQADFWQNKLTNPGSKSDVNAD